MSKSKIVTSSDSLRQTAGEIQDYLQKQGIVLFYGSDAGSSAKRVYWQADLGGDWKAFLHCAQALGAKPVYLYRSDFSELDLFDLEDEDARRVFESRVGQTCLVELSFYWNGLIHSYHQVADWYAEFEDLAGNELLDEDMDDDELDERPF